MGWRFLGVEAPNFSADNLVDDQAIEEITVLPIVGGGGLAINVIVYRFVY